MPTGDPNRREVMGTSLAMFALPQTLSANSSPRYMRSRGISVVDHGAKGDGVTDDTDSFNRATRATEPWSGVLPSVILVPSGRYRIDGTVYVRKGQHLLGDGEPTVIDARNATDTTFRLGSGRNANEVRDDPGGAPVQISDLQTLGGAPSRPLIFTNAQGFAIRRLFLSAPGTAIGISGADGFVSEITIDQSLNGIVLSGCQNVIISDLITYLSNYAITVNADVRDIIIRSAQFCYSKYAAVLVSDAAHNMTNVRITSSSFIMNEQFSTFLGYIYCRASEADLACDNSNFRNWPGYAIDQAAGRGAKLSFTSCQFDGRPSHPQYNGSSTARVAATGIGGTIRFVECEFSYLHGEIALARPELALLSLAGGLVEDCPFPRIQFAINGMKGVVVRDVVGFAS